MVVCRLSFNDLRWKETRNLFSKKPFYETQCSDAHSTILNFIKKLGNPGSARVFPYLVMGLNVSNDCIDDNIESLIYKLK